MNEWKGSKAEAEMQEAGRKMMAEAAKKKAEKASSSPKQLGSWEVSLTSSTEHSEEDIRNFMEKLIEFENQCNQDLPMLRVHVNPIIKV